MANTNVRRDSDVDVCIRLNSTFFYDLPPGLTKEYFGYRPATLLFPDYKDMVQRALFEHFGEDDVKRGTKAFTIRDNSYRVHADAVPTLAYRDHNHNPAHLGVAFDPDGGGQRIRNFPVQALANGISKNNRTNRYYKRAVRIMKRARNHLREKGVEAAKFNPSFQIESLVYNVGDHAFMKSTWRHTMQVVIEEAFKLTLDPYNPVEVNEIKPLFGPHCGWTRDNARAFLRAVHQEIGFP